MLRLSKIVSGGQTGADRAALDFAVAHGIPHGGWCPQGRKAEDGPIHSRYQLVETPTTDYAERTEWNVRDSDGTVIFTLAETLSGGSKHTRECCLAQHKPWLRLAARKTGEQAPALLSQFIEEHRIQVNKVGSGS